jgi:xylan 1,4-beta-xylosidase
MIAHATEKQVPLDFVSSHVYGNDTAENVFGQSDRKIPPHGMVCAAVQHVHQQIKASARPDLPLIWSEFNATYMNQPEITDSIYMGPWMASTIAQCDGLVTMMSYWTFSDVFEEQGVVKTPFYGGYGLIAEDDIPKPAFDAFALLHTFGTQRIANPAANVLVTKRDDGALVLALWNPQEPGQSVPPRKVQIMFGGVAPSATASVERVDAEHGDTYAAWQKIGSPRYPTPQQVQLLRGIAKLPPPTRVDLNQGRLELTVPPSGLAIVTVR